MTHVLTVSKALNNNVVIAQDPVLDEVVLIGKGIGFNRKKGDTIEASDAEKTFLLSDKKEM